MGTRTTACLFALAILTPFAVASGPSTYDDPAGDEFIRVLLAPDVAGLCDAPSSDIVGLVLDASGNDLVATLTLRDAAGELTCDGASLGAPTHRGVHVNLYNPLYSVGFHVSGSPELGVRACWDLRVHPDGFARACEQKAWGEEFVGNAWTSSIPLRGTATTYAGATVPYDLRDQPYSLSSSVYSGYGLRGVVASAADGTGTVVYQS